MSWVKATIIKTLSGSIEETSFAYSASYLNDSEEQTAFVDVYRWGETEGRLKAQQLEQSDSSGKKYSYKITRY